MLGRRKTRDGDSGHEDSRRGVSGMAGSGEEGVGADACLSDDEADDRDCEEPRDILAVCKHGDSLGIAAVS